MARLSSFLKYLFNPEPDSNVVAQRNALAVAHFEGLNSTFEQMQAQIPDEWGQLENASSPDSERAKVFYALATARMQLAQQLHAAFLEDQQKLTTDSSSQARLDLEI